MTDPYTIDYEFSSTGHLWWKRHYFNVTIHGPDGRTTTLSGNRPGRRYDDLMLHELAARWVAIMSSPNERALR